MKSVRKLVVAGLCTALGTVLPMAVHAIPNMGSVLLPMHLPVLLCGLICGPWYGLACGTAVPALSSGITGMPLAAYLPAMMLELAAYGLISGLLMRWVRTKKPLLDIYIALIGAMLGGRAVFGAANALIFRAGEYSMKLWLGAVFVTGAPGIAAQLVLVPLIITALTRAKVISIGK